MGARGGGPRGGGRGGWWSSSREWRELSEDVVNGMVMLRWMSSSCGEVAGVLRFAIAAGRAYPVDIPESSSPGPAVQKLS